MRTLKINLQNEKGKLNRFFSACIGAGRAGEVMRYVPMMQLRQMQKECPFRYIRFHGIFHEEMNVVHRDENGNISFCFQYIDTLLGLHFHVIDCAKIRKPIHLRRYHLTLFFRKAILFHD